MNSQNNNSKKNSLPVDLVKLSGSYYLDLRNIKNKRKYLILQLLIAYGNINGVYSNNDKNKIKKNLEISNSSDERYYSKQREDEIENAFIAQTIMFASRNDLEKVSIVEDKQQGQSSKMDELCERLGRRITINKGMDDNNEYTYNIKYEKKKNGKDDKETLNDLFEAIRATYERNNEMSVILNQIKGITEIIDDDEKKTKIKKMIDEIVGNRISFKEETNNNSKVKLKFATHDKINTSSGNKTDGSKGSFVVGCNVISLPEFNKEEIISASDNIIKCKRGKKEYTIFKKFGSYMTEEDGKFDFYDPDPDIGFVSNCTKKEISGVPVITSGNIKNKKGLIVRLDDTHAGQTLRATNIMQNIYTSNIQYDSKSIGYCEEKVCDDEGNIIKVVHKYDVDKPLEITKGISEKDVGTVKKNGATIEHEDKCKQTIYNFFKFKVHGLPNKKHNVYLDVYKENEEDRYLADLYIKQNNEEKINQRALNEKKEAKKQELKKKAIKREKERNEKRINDIKNGVNNDENKGLTQMDKSKIKEFINTITKVLPEQPVLKKVNNDDISLIRRFFENLMSIFFGSKTTLEKKQEEEKIRFDISMRKWKSYHRDAMSDKYYATQCLEEYQKEGKLELTQEQTDSLNKYCKEYNINHTFRPIEHEQNEDTNQKNLINLNQNNKTNEPVI